MVYNKSQGYEYFCLSSNINPLYFASLPKMKSLDFSSQIIPQTERYRKLNKTLIPHCKKSVLKIQEYIHEGKNLKFYFPKIFNFKLLIPEYSKLPHTFFTVLFRIKYVTRLHFFINILIGRVSCFTTKSYYEFRESYAHRYRNTVVFREAP
jgi:hypothetical protein